MRMSLSLISPYFSRKISVGKWQWMYLSWEHIWAVERLHAGGGVYFGSLEEVGFLGNQYQ